MNSLRNKLLAWLLGAVALVGAAVVLLGILGLTALIQFFVLERRTHYQ